MEEAFLDQGLDRLPLFFIYLLAIIFPASTLATTFGPLPLAGQLRNAEYIVHGTVRGNSWVEMDQKINRPFTYWKVEVIDDISKRQPGENIDLRSPGGEINGFGYHVAGSAKFADGEEIFVIAKSTDRHHVLDIVGLASGKYVVETGADGKKIVRSALGFPVLDASGKAFSPQGFLAFARRVKAGKETEAERNIMLNKDLMHAHDGVSLTAPKIAEKNEPLQSTNPLTKPATKPTTKTVEPSQINAEEPREGSGNWQLLLGIGAAVFLIGSAILFSKR